jgi:hypothetical protein
MIGAGKLRFACLPEADRETDMNSTPTSTGRRSSGWTVFCIVFAIALLYEIVNGQDRSFFDAIWKSGVNAGEIVVLLFIMCAISGGIYAIGKRTLTRLDRACTSASERKHTRFGRFIEILVIAAVCAGVLLLAYRGFEHAWQRRQETNVAARQCEATALIEARKEFGESLALTARVQGDVIRTDDTGTAHACAVVVAGMPDKQDYLFSVMVNPDMQTARLSN